MKNYLIVFVFGVMGLIFPRMVNCQTPTVQSDLEAKVDQYQENLKEKVESFAKADKNFRGELDDLNYRVVTHFDNEAYDHLADDLSNFEHTGSARAESGMYGKKLEVYTKYASGLVCDGMWLLKKLNHKEYLRIGKKLLAGKSLMKVSIDILVALVTLAREGAK